MTRRRGQHAAVRVQVILKRLERGSNAAIVRDVLAQRQVTIDVHARKHLKRRVLRRQARGALLEIRQTRVRPPIAERTSAVVLTPLVVEAVRQLVALMNK